MSQIKAQKLRLTFQPGKLQETLNDTLQLVELQAKKKGLELCLIIAPDVPPNISTDHMRLSQIVLNLLNNATKFTQKGSVTLSASTTDDPACLKISVKDSGIGMTREDIKKLFSDYTHIEFSDRVSVNPSGVGLGLSIAYSLAKLLGPQENKGITVESVPGIGSTFSFFVENKEEQIEVQDICVRRASDKSHKGIAEEFQMMEPKVSSKISRCISTNSLLLANERLLSRVGSEGPRCVCPKILVVDDNPFNTMAFEAVLGSLNVKCDSVFDGRAAIDKIRERQKTLCVNNCNCKPYNVVFMDQEMPGMTGSETVVEIKRLQMQGLILPMKIVGCTAHGSAEEVDRFMESGIDMCIHKPITGITLQRILEGEI